MARKTLDEIRAIPGPYISAADAAAYIGIDPQIIRVAAAGKSKFNCRFPRRNGQKSASEFPRGRLSNGRRYERDEDRHRQRAYDEMGDSLNH